MEARLHVGGHLLRVLQAVAVADEHGLLLRADGALLHVVHQGLEGGASPPGLAHVDQMPLVVHVEHRLDGQHGAHDGGGRADAPAPLQKVQVVHREPVGHVELVLLHPVPDLPDGLPGLSQLGGVPDQQGLAAGGGQGVHREDRPVREPLPQLLHRDQRGLVGGRQAGGEHQQQHVPPRLQNGGEGLGIVRGVDGGGSDGLPRAQLVVKELRVHLPVVGVMGIDPVPQGKFHGKDFNVVFPGQADQQLGACVCDNGEFTHGKVPP